MLCKIYICVITVYIKSQARCRQFILTWIEIIFFCFSSSDEVYKWWSIRKRRSNSQRLWELLESNNTQHHYIFVAAYTSGFAKKISPVCQGRHYHRSEWFVQIRPWITIQVYYHYWWTKFGPFNLVLTHPYFNPKKVAY